MLLLGQRKDVFGFKNGAKSIFLIRGTDTVRDQLSSHLQSLMSLNCTLVKCKIVAYSTLAIVRSVSLNVT